MAGVRFFGWAGADWGVDDGIPYSSGYSQYAMGTICHLAMMLLTVYVILH